MYYLFILAIGVERLIEMVVLVGMRTGRLPTAAREFGRGHFPAMIAMHTLLLVSCIVEVAAFHRPFLPWLGWPMVGVVAASAVLRWWCVSVLGKHWNPRLIVIPDAPLVHRGPYRFLHHPNYAAVTAEVLALPLVHSAWLTAIVFAIASALVLNVRIGQKSVALGYA